MTKRYVYLAGPITGTTESEANDWRKQVADALEPHNIVGVSPLRCEPIHGPTYGTLYPDERFGTARAIANKNVFDVDTCDMTLVYLPTPAPGKPYSIGTICELSWAYKAGKRTILVTTDPYLKRHPVIDAQASWSVDTFDEAIDILVGVLGGYAGGKNV